MAEPAECIFSLLFLILTFFSSFYGLKILFQVLLNFSIPLGSVFQDDLNDPIFIKMGFFLDFLWRIYGSWTWRRTFSCIFLSFLCMGVMRGGIGDFFSLSAMFGKNQLELVTPSTQKLSEVKVRNIKIQDLLSFSFILFIEH